MGVSHFGNIAPRPWWLCKEVWRRPVIPQPIGDRKDEPLDLFISDAVTFAFVSLSFTCFVFFYLTGQHRDFYMTINQEINQIITGKLYLRHYAVLFNFYFTLKTVQWVTFCLKVVFLITVLLECIEINSMETQQTPNLNTRKQEFCFINSCFLCGVKSEMQKPILFSTSTLIYGLNFLLVVSQTEVQGGNLWSKEVKILFWL